MDHSWGSSWTRVQYTFLEHHSPHWPTVNNCLLHSHGTDCTGPSACRACLNVFMSVWPYGSVPTWGDLYKPCPCCQADVWSLCGGQSVRCCTLSPAFLKTVIIREVISLPWGVHICVVIYLLFALHRFSCMGFGFDLYFIFCPCKTL